MPMVTLVADLVMWTIAHRAMFAAYVTPGRETPWTN